MPLSVSRDRGRRCPRVVIVGVGPVPLRSKDTDSSAVEEDSTECSKNFKAWEAKFRCANLKSAKKPSVGASSPPVVMVFSAPLSIPPSACHCLPSSRSSSPHSPFLPRRVIASRRHGLHRPPLSVPPSACHCLPSSRSSSRHLSPFLPHRVIASRHRVLHCPLSIPPSSCHRLPLSRSSSRPPSPFLPRRVIASRRCVLHRATSLRSSLVVSSKSILTFSRTRVRIAEIERPQSTLRVSMGTARG